MGPTCDPWITDRHVIQHGIPGSQTVVIPGSPHLIHPLLQLAGDEEVVENGAHPQKLATFLRNCAYSYYSKDTVRFKSRLPSVSETNDNEGMIYGMMCLICY